MVARLREKPGGEALDVVVGDMTSATTSKTYPLVYLVFNTVYNILTQEGQVECFRNAARHLEDGGLFVIEAAPPWILIRGNQFVNVEYISTGSVVLDVNQYDHVTQILDENHVTSPLTASGWAPSHAVSSGQARWTSWRRLRASGLSSGRADGTASRSSNRARFM